MKLLELLRIESVTYFILSSICFPLGEEASEALVNHITHITDNNRLTIVFVEFFGFM